MRNYKLTVNHYLNTSIGKGEHPVYIRLIYKRQVTRIRSAIEKGYSSERLMLRECKRLIAQETAQINAIVREGIKQNPNYSISDFTRLLKVKPTNRLEALTKQSSETNYSFNGASIEELILQKNAINRYLREVRKGNIIYNGFQTQKQLSLF